MPELISLSSPIHRSPAQLGRLSLPPQKMGYTAPASIPSAGQSVRFGGYIPIVFEAVCAACCLIPMVGAVVMAFLLTRLGKRLTQKPKA